MASSSMKCNLLGIMIAYGIGTVMVLIFSIVSWYIFWVFSPALLMMISFSILTFSVLQDFSSWLIALFNSSPMSVSISV